MSGFTTVDRGKKKKHANTINESTFKATEEEINARVGVASHAIEQLAVYNEHRIADGQKPHDSLVEVAKELRDAGAHDAAKYYFELNNQNNQAKHDFSKNFK